MRKNETRRARIRISGLLLLPFTVLA